MGKAAGARRGGGGTKEGKKGGWRGELTEMVLKFEGAGLGSQTEKEEKGVWYTFWKNTKYLHNIEIFAKFGSVLQIGLVCPV